MYADMCVEVKALYHAHQFIGAWPVLYAQYNAEAIVIFAALEGS